MENLNALLEKYDHFRLEQFHSIEKPAEDTIRITLAVQDDYGEETHHVKFTFRKIKNAKLLVNDALAFLDMMSGVTLIKERELYGFAIGDCPAMLNVIHAPFFIVAEEVEAEEIAL